MDRVDEKYFNIFESIIKEYEEYQELLSSVEIMSDNKLYMHYLKKQKQIKDIAELFSEYKNYDADMKTNEELIAMIADEETKKQLKAENEKISEKQKEILNKMKQLYNRNVLEEKQKVKIEISTKSVGSDFVNSFKNLFMLFAEKEKYSYDITKLNGEISCALEIVGDLVYDKLKNFTGLYRVINNGDTMSGTICVLDEKILSDEISEDDIEIQTSKSSGAGGQHINKTESAVRIIHKPTGISVECQDERSQLKNKTRALENLKNKISQINQENNEKYIKNQRKIIQNAIFSDTPAFIFDYNKHVVFVTKTKKEYEAESVLSGDLNNIINDLRI